VAYNFACHVVKRSCPAVVLTSAFGVKSAPGPSAASRLHVLVKLASSDQPAPGRFAAVASVFKYSLWLSSRLVVRLTVARLVNSGARF
jgi:hypothetical protein